MNESKYRQCCRVLFMLFLFCTGANFQGYTQDMGSGPLVIEQVNKRLFLDIADTILNREIIIVTRVATGSAVQGQKDLRKMYPGMTFNQITVRFVHARGKIQLEEVNHHIRNTDGLSVIDSAIQGYNQYPVLATFDKIEGLYASQSRIDVTDLVMGENPIFGPDRVTKQGFALESFQSARSVFLRAERFPNGMDIRVFRTYASGGGSRSMELNASFLLLPKERMVGRLADDRVVSMGFNVQDFTDFGVSTDHAVNGRYAYRYRLAPEKRDRARYLRGELVTPAQPIIFYLDPNTPEALIPYFKKAMMMWKCAFERAGFKDALQIRLAPKTENEFNYFSMRYNTVDYLASDSYGGHADIIVDMRSAEIINSRVRIPHSNLAYHRTRYMVLAGAVDPDARRARFSDELNGELAAVVVAHELGHCFGVHHKYLSSALVPVENLRNKKWVEENGISPSIMDYSRHNYVAQPQDHIARQGLLPRVGAYDQWAIEWLYKWFPINNERQQKESLNGIYNQRIAKDPLIEYISTRWSIDDMRLRMEDVGDDAIKASSYGIRNLKLVVPSIREWTLKEKGQYDDDLALEVYKEVLTQYRFFAEHVANNIGGTRISIDENNFARISGRVDKKEQKASIDFLATQVFETPNWLLDPALINVLGTSYPTSYLPEQIFQVQSKMLDKIFDLARLIKLKKGTIADSTQYSCDEMLTDLEKKMFRELESAEPIMLERRNIQAAYVRKVARMFLSLGRNDFLRNECLIFRSHLEILRSDFQKALSGINNRETGLHLKQLISDIDESLLPTKS